jgi:hypothetical protein
MNLSMVNNAVRQFGRSIDRNSPTILTALAVAGVVSTVAMAIKATSKAKDALNEEANYRADEWSSQTGEHQSAYPDDFFTQKEIIEITWRFYVPTAVSGLITIGSMIGANHISLRRNAALLSLLSMAETAAREYQEKVVEQIGERKAEKINEEIVQDHLDKHPVDEKAVILTGNGSYLCFDDFSGRYFRSDVESIRRGANTFNQMLLREGWLGINHFYYEIGLDPIELGDEFGWIAERSLLELRLNTKLAKDTQEPCLVIGYSVTPNHI